MKRSHEAQTPIENVETKNPRDTLRSLIELHRSRNEDNQAVRVEATQRVYEKTSAWYLAAMSEAQVAESVQHTESTIRMDRQGRTIMAQEFLAGNINKATKQAVYELAWYEAQVAQTEYYSVRTQSSTPAEELQYRQRYEAALRTIKWANETHEQYCKAQQFSVTTSTASPLRVANFTSDKTVDTIMQDLTLTVARGSVTTEVSAHISHDRAAEKTGLDQRDVTRTMELKLQPNGISTDKPTTITVTDALHFATMEGLGAKGDLMTEKGSLYPTEKTGIEIDGEKWGVQKIVYSPEGTPQRELQTLANNMSNEDLAAVIKLVRTIPAANVDERTRQRIDCTFVNFNGVLLQVWETDTGVLSIDRLKVIPDRYTTMSRQLEHIYIEEAATRNATKCTEIEAKVAPELVRIRVDDQIRNAEQEALSIRDERLARRLGDKLTQEINDIEMEQIRAMRQSGVIPLYEFTPSTRTAHIGMSGTEKTIIINEPHVVVTIGSDALHPSAIPVAAGTLAGQLFAQAYTFRQATRLSSLDTGGIKGTGETPQEKIEYLFRTRLQQEINARQSQWVKRDTASKKAGQ